LSTIRLQKDPHGERDAMGRGPGQQSRQGSGAADSPIKRKEAKESKNFLKLNEEAVSNPASQIRASTKQLAQVFSGITDAAHHALVPPKTTNQSHRPILASTLHGQQPGLRNSQNINH